MTCAQCGEPAPRRAMRATARTVAVADTPDEKKATARYTLVPDERWPGMWRIRRPDGSLTDMVNLARALDAMRELDR
jgi:hypothetical protein